MPKLRDSVLAHIQSENIRPRPRWQYVLLHIGLWATGISTIILGSFAFGYMLFEFSLPERVYLSWMEMRENNWIEALPYLWGIGMVFAFTFGYFLFSRTERGYRFNTGVIALSLILGSLLGGWLLYRTHTVHWGDRQIQRFAKPYREFRRGFSHRIPRPEDGFLPLRISSIDGDNVVGSAPNNEVWLVQMKCQNLECREGQAHMALNKPTIFQGKIIGDNMFESGNILLPRHTPKYKILNRLPR